MFDSLIIKYKKVCNSLNISPIKILLRTKLVQNIILHNFSYVTFSQKVNIKGTHNWNFTEILQNFVFF